jgi:hypothetical protein
MKTLNASELKTIKRHLTDAMALEESPIVRGSEAEIRVVARASVAVLAAIAKAEGGEA